MTVYTKFCRYCNSHGGIDGEGCPFCLGSGLFDSLIHAPILAFPTETGQYILDTDASNFGLGGVLSQREGDVECVVAYCSRAFNPRSDVIALLNRSYIQGTKFTLRTDHKSLVCLHRFKDMEGMMARWLHALQQFQLSIVYRPGRDHGNADSLSRVPSSPCRQCTRPDCPPAVDITEYADQPFDSESTSSSEDTDLIPIHSGEDWVAWLDDDLSHPSAVAGDSFRISALQKEDPVCITLSSWISSGIFPTWNEVRGLCPELRLLWHHRNNPIVDDNGIIWRRRSTHSPLLQLLVPKPVQKELFLLYHASLFGGHLGRNRTLHLFPIKNKCADTVVDILVEKIILRFGMPLAIHSDQGREFENENVPFWDALRLGLLLTNQSRMAWSNASIERVS